MFDSFLMFFGMFTRPGIAAIGEGWLLAAQLLLRTASEDRVETIHQNHLAAVQRMDV